MWKDFFYFNKSERRAIIVLTFLIAIVQVVLWTTDYWLPLLPEYLTENSANQKALDVFQDSLSENNVAPSSRNYDDYGPSGKKMYVGGRPEILTVFNPNTADSAKLVSLGLRPYVAKNIIKYRNKGGTFRKAEDFAKIYGIDQAQFARLKPYIRIGSANSSESQVYSGLKSKDFDEKKEFDELSHGSSNGNHPSMNPSGFTEAIPSSAKSQAALILDINQMDTTDLQQLKGVGATTANRIKSYRNRLGGFYSIHQLEEIKGLYPDALTRLQSILKVDTTQILKINANKASLERLKSHPYLTFYQAKVIVELRKARSRIKNIHELAEFKEFSKEDIEKLRWYLSF